MAETLLKSQQAFGGDGWQPAKETWAYASASTITVPSGAASKYQKGDRIKWTQTGVRYGVIVAVADTLLTIAVNTDYVVADAAISANYYSHQANPLGYPGYFNYTPTYVGFTASVPNLGVKFTMLNNNVVMNYIILGNGTSNATNFTATIVGTAISYSQGQIHVRDNDVNKNGYYQIDTSGTIVTFYSDVAKSGFTNSGNKAASGWISYYI